MEKNEKDLLMGYDSLQSFLEARERWMWLDKSNTAFKEYESKQEEVKKTYQN